MSNARGGGEQTVVHDYCPNCGKKGYLPYSGFNRDGSLAWIGHRCKYCHHIDLVTDKNYKKILNGR